MIITPINPIPFPRQKRAHTAYEKTKRDVIDLTPVDDATEHAVKMIEQGAAMLAKLDKGVSEAQLERLSSAALNMLKATGGKYA